MTINSDIKPVTGQGRLWRFLRALTVFVPGALYVVFFFGAAASYGGLWGKAVLMVTGAYFVLAFVMRNRALGAGAYFLLGLAIASFAEAKGVLWLRMGYMPYVFAGFYFFGSRFGVAFVAAVPLFEARRLMMEFSAEEAAVMAFSLASGVAGFAYSLRAASFAWTWKKRPTGGLRRGRSRPVGGGAAPEGQEPYDDAPPLDMGGLMREDDEALRELLRITVFATRALGVSLFVRTDDSLRLRCSSIPQRPGGDIISPVPRWFVNDVQRLKHAIVTGNLGAETTQGFSNRTAPLSGMEMLRGPGAGDAGDAVSIAAAPVLVGSMVVGVLAVNSPLSNAFRGNVVTVLELLSAQVARTLSRGRVFAETERDAGSLRLVYEESARLVSSIDLKEILSIVAEVMNKISGMDVHIYIRTPSGFAMAFQSAPSSAKPGRVEMGGTLADMVLGEGETRYISTLRGYKKALLPNHENREFESALLMPLACGGETMGLVALTSVRKSPLRAEDITRLDMVGSQAAISLKNSMFHTEAKVKAATDGLTGLNNRRRFTELLDAEHKRFLRTGMRYVVIMMDADHFKAVNDNHGHQAGDEVLKAIASIMQGSFRETDILGRYGGEEFVAVLVDTDHKGAMKLAERMRQAIERGVIATSAGDLSITMSLGVAMVDNQVTYEEVMRRADEALYEAKETGRNRVVLWRGN